MPDYAGIMAASTAAQQTQELSKITREQLAWAKEKAAKDEAQIQPIIDRMIRGMDKQNEYADEQKKFYDENYRPLEEGLIKTANEYDTPEYREYRAAEVGADTAQKFKGAQDAAAQQLKDFGVDPSSPRYASTALVGKLTQAGATAGAENAERDRVRAEGLALKQNAVNTGRGYAGAVNATWANAGNSGNSAVGNTNATSANASSMMGNPTQWGGLGNQALGTWGGIANNNYSNYLQGYQFQNTPQSSGIGSALGLAAGVAASRIPGLADGGAIPMEASPSMGANTDDIPARLNAGEFIMPREAVSWFGEKSMHDMIIKAQKERAQTEQQSGAVPDMMPARPEAPRLISGAKPVAALPAR